MEARWQRLWKSPSERWAVPARRRQHAIPWLKNTGWSAELSSWKSMRNQEYSTSLFSELPTPQWKIGGYLCVPWGRKAHLKKKLLPTSCLGPLISLFQLSLKGLQCTLRQTQGKLYTISALCGPQREQESATLLPAELLEKVLEREGSRCSANSDAQHEESIDL